MSGHAPIANGTATEITNPTHAKTLRLDPPGENSRAAHAIAKAVPTIPEATECNQFSCMSGATPGRIEAFDQIAAPFRPIPNAINAPRMKGNIR
jgi:hypothetical protein